MNLTLLILITAFLVLLIGLLFYGFSSRKGYERPHAPILMSWLLVALFPVLLLFAFFPGSSISGTILSFSAGGAAGLYIFLWWYGSRVYRQAFGLDNSMQRLEREKQELENELQNLKIQGPQASKSAELHHGVPYTFQVKGRRGKKIALISGRIEEVKEADAWVSSENIDMQMARFYDRSISGVIRYCGAKKNTSGNVIDDIIAKELKDVVSDQVPVAPATVFITGSGELEKDNNVKKIFHVASVRGEAGIGYVPVENIQFCISRTLKVADSECRNLGIKTILFPLLGTGTARGKLEDIVPRLIQTALSYLEATETSVLECIYFLVRTDVERDACFRAFQQLAQSGRLIAARGSI